MTVLQNLSIYSGLTALFEGKEQISYASNKAKYILKKWYKQTEMPPSRP